MAETTSFSTVYDSFLSKVTDDMYMELYPAETNDMLQDLLLTAIPWFEFPKVDVSDYDLATTLFNMELSNEEVNILATYMVVAWMGQQLASVENTRMKYSGSDFKFTSQAAHMGKILAIRDSYKQEGYHLQRLYKRRSVDTSTGLQKSTFAQIMEKY
jgi:hypothetical protein